jgi:RNA-binding protein YhbY
MLRRVPVARSWPPALGPPQARSLVCVAASQQTQPKLTSAEKKALRTKSQRQNDSLVVVNCGANGLSQPFLEGLYDALRRNQMVKVRMGCSRQEKKDKEAEIEQRLDCVLIHSIGSTSIFFRQKGLSKPRGLSFTGGVVGDIGDEQYRDVTDADRIPGKKGRGEKDVAAAVAAERPEFKILR